MTQIINDHTFKQVFTVVADQYTEMREMHGHSVESDVEDNSDYELCIGAQFIVYPANENCDNQERLEMTAQLMPHWNQKWLARTFEKTYKDRLKVGISLLIAELERVMYLENQRISNNDSSTASSSGDPESNG